MTIFRAPANFQMSFDSMDQVKAIAQWSKSTPFSPGEAESAAQIVESYYGRKHLAKIRKGAQKDAKRFMAKNAKTKVKKAAKAGAPPIPRRFPQSFELLDYSLMGALKSDNPADREIAARALAGRSASDVPNSSFIAKSGSQSAAALKYGMNPLLEAAIRNDLLTNDDPAIREAAWRELNADG